MLSHDGIPFVLLNLLLLFAEMEFWSLMGLWFVNLRLRTTEKKIAKVVFYFSFNSTLIIYVENM